MDQSLVIFIGSGEASLLERKTLMYSLRKHASLPLDIRVFNGTHNCIEYDDGRREPAGLPLGIKVHNVATEFSLYRYLIPQLCGYSGAALWLDSDMVCLGDIADLFRLPWQDKDFLAKPGAYSDDLGEGWGPSAMLINCNRCRFDLNAIVADIESGRFELKDFMQFTAKFLSAYPFEIGQLPRRWNDFDYMDDDTRIIHYTNLSTQPWKRAGHPFGDIWHQYFHESIQSGHISPEEVDITVLRGFCRFDVLQGNSRWKHLFRVLRRELRGR